MASLCYKDESRDYNPWVEEDRMEKIRLLLEPALGKPKWLVDSTFATWTKGPRMDDDIATVCTPKPFNRYSDYLILRARQQAKSAVPPRA